MGTTLVITFRETLEMMLMIIPLIVYLKKIDKASLTKYIYGGILGGVTSSIVVGTLIYFVLTSLNVASQEVFIGFLALIISGLIAYNIVIINKKKTFAQSDNFNNITTISSLFLLSFITVFRESLEIILFTLPTLTGSLLNCLIGGILGILLTILAGFIIYKSSLKINVDIIFIGISLLLIYFGAFLFGEGLTAFLPQLGDSVQNLGMLIYGLPTLLIYIKKTLKKYENKLLK